MRRLAYIVAGEPSGDKIAASLMRSQNQSYHFHGIGGPLMAAEGLICDHDYTRLQIVGLFDAIRHYRDLKSLLSSLVDEVCQLRPQVIYTIDAKGFSLRFAREVKKRMAKEGWSAKLVHVVAPTIWAYGKKRAQAFEAVFDAMLCLFPMEKDAFKTSDIQINYIGHPAAYEAPIKRRIETQGPLKCLILPGSRKSEITSLLPAFLSAAQKLNHNRPLQVTIVSIAAQKNLIEALVARSDLSVTLVTGQRALKEAFATHDVMLAASGTVTLEAALSAIPGVVAYRLHPLVAVLMKWRFYLSDPVLPNIILQDEVYPFIFQRDVNASFMTHALQTLVSDPKRHDRLARQAAELRAQLTNGAPCFDKAIGQALSEILGH